MKRGKKRIALLLAGTLAAGSCLTGYATEQAEIMAEEVLTEQTLTGEEKEVLQEETQTESQTAVADKPETEAETGVQESRETETETGVQESGESETDPQQTDTQQAGTEMMTETEEIQSAVQENGNDSRTVSDRERVKKLIEALPVLEEVKASHAGQILAAWNAFYALSAADQAALDAEMGSKSGQSYGRDLETAYWGWKALDAADASTSLRAGIYDGSTVPALSSTYSKGKSSSSRQRPWSVKSVTVDENGQAVGVIAVESDSYTYIRTNGRIYQRTNSSGNSEFAGIPIDLNSTFYIAAYSTSMNGEIAFSITTSILEGGQGGGEEEIPLTGISLSAGELSMFTQEVHDALEVTLEPENNTYRGGIAWSSSDPKVISVNEKTGELSALSAGLAVITAEAGGFRACCTVKVSEKVPDGTVSLKVINKTAMFKAADAYITTKNGKSLLYLTLNGDGYRELFPGSYDEAVATGSDSTKWIAGKVRTDNALLTYTDVNGENKREKAAGKWQFVIPIASGSSCLQIQALSNGHKKDGYWWYPRQIFIDMEGKTAVVDDYRGTQELQIVNSAKNISVSSAALTTVGGPHSNGYQVSLSLELEKPAYTKAYLGTAEKAKKNKKDSFEIKNNTITFAAEQIVGTGSDAAISSRIGKPFALSLYSSVKKKWVTFEVTIDKKEGKIFIKSFGKDSQDTQPPVDPSRLNANSDTMPGTVNSSTTLADGVYGPDQFRFTFSGGSGRVKVTCQKVEVKDGRAYATVTFERTSKQGGSSSYDSLRANGRVYSGNNTFTIPVELNKNNTIVGRTIAMSAPHWVEYKIFISISEPGRQAGENQDQAADEMDQQAPDIMGLQGGKTVEFEYAEKVKVFAYEDGYYLIEVDAMKDTFRDTERYRKFIETHQEETVDEAAEDPDMEEEGSGSQTVSDDDTDAQAEALYGGRTMKYLVIPEGEDAPAGLEKEMILIRQPLESVYVSSKSALEIICGLSLEERIRSIGIPEEELTETEFEKIVEKMKLPEENENHMVWGGSYDDWELRTMLKEKTDLMIEASDILPDREDTLEEDMDHFMRLAKRADQMGAAMFLDRSSDEKNEQAAKEWRRVYEILFRCEQKEGKTAA